MKDLMEKYQLERKTRAEKPWLIRNILNAKDFIWYRCILNAKDIPFNLKMVYQRITKGYCEEDVWNLNSFIVNKTYKPLKEFVKHYEEHGLALPAEFATDPGSWTLILKKIEYAFDDVYNSEHDYDYDRTRYTGEKLEEHYKKVEEGLTLFGKYLRNLWD